MEPAPFVVVDALGEGVPASETEAVGRVEADAAEPEAEVPALAVVPIAAAWKAANDFSAVGLMAKTIPALQWLFGENGNQ